MEAIKTSLDSIVVPAFSGGSGQIPMEVIAHHMRLAWDQITEWADNPQKKTFKTAIKVKME